MTASNRPHHCPTCRCRANEPSPEDAEFEIARLAQLVGTTYAAIIGIRKTDSVAARRHAVVVAFLQLHPGLSLVATGRYFRRDHSTIINSLKRVRLALVEDLVSRYRQVEGAKHGTSDLQ